MVPFLLFTILNLLFLNRTTCLDNFLTGGFGKYAIGDGQSNSDITASQNLHLWRHAGNSTYCTNLLQFSGCNDSPFREKYGKPTNINHGKRRLVWLQRMQTATAQIWDAFNDIANFRAHAVTGTRSLTLGATTARFSTLTATADLYAPLAFGM